MGFVADVDPGLDFVQGLVAVRARRVMGSRSPVLVHILTVDVHGNIRVTSHDDVVTTVLQTTFQIPGLLHDQYGLFQVWSAIIKVLGKPTVTPTMAWVKTYHRGTREVCRQRNRRLLFRHDWRSDFHWLIDSWFWRGID